jgi:DNA-binding LacI/PurR family transcriptional regulator
MEALRDLMPVVFVESESHREDIDQVLVDGIDAYRKIFSYLSAKGFMMEDIAIVYGKEDSFSRLRISQCDAVLNEIGTSLRGENVIYSNWRAEDGYESMKVLIGREKKPKVVIYLSDVMALGGMRAAHDLGMIVPDDISVIGFNDARFSAYYQPSLTTLDYKPEQLGIAAARQILNRLKNPELPVQTEILTTELQIRESVK